MATVQRTMFAAKAMDFAQLFKSLCGPATLETTLGRYHPELSTPEGESTGGGKQSVQHVKLVPEQTGAVTVVMGSVDSKEKKAELRSYLGFVQMLERRFREAGPIPDEPSYQALLQKIHAFVGSQGFVVTLKDREPDPVVAKPAPARPRSASPGVPSRDARASDDQDDGSWETATAPSSAPKFVITVVTAVVAMIIALIVLAR